MNDIPVCMLIEDDVDDQEIFSMALEEIDIEIQCIISDSGVDALKTLRSEGAVIPDYIFIDVNMPKMNGLECLQEIRGIEQLSNAAVFMYTTTSDDRIIAKSKELGAKGFIVKPSGLKLLTETLTEIFLKK